MEMREKMRSLILMATLGLAGCGELAPSNQTANLPANQNTNIANSQTSSPSPVPTFVVSNTSNTTPEAENNNTANNISNGNFPVNQNVNTIANDVPANTELVAVEKLIIPVAGIKREDLRDTFKDSRSEGRVHDAIDIMAAQGTPVLATADGEIARFFDSERGGITVYQFSRDKKLIYYYAHLQRRAEHLQEKQFVKQGMLIGYVGDTGNAGAGNFHLHFAIWTVDDPKRYWDGTNLNPYDLLR